MEYDVCDGQMSFDDIFEDLSKEPPGLLRDDPEVLELVIPADRRAIAVRNIPEEFQLMPLKNDSSIIFSVDAVDYEIGITLPTRLELDYIEQLKDVSINVQEFMRIVSGVKTLLNHHFTQDTRKMVITLSELTNWFHSACYDKDGGRFFSEKITSLELKNKIHKAVLMMFSSYFRFVDTETGEKRTMQFANVSWNENCLKRSDQEIIYTFVDDDTKFLGFSRAKYLTINSKKMLFGKYITKKASPTNYKKGKGRPTVYKYDQVIFNAFLILERRIAQVTDSGEFNGTYNGKPCYVVGVSFSELYQVIPQTLPNERSRSRHKGRIFDAVNECLLGEKKFGNIIDYKMLKSTGRGASRPDNFIIYF